METPTERVRYVCRFLSVLDWVCWQLNGCFSLQIFASLEVLEGMRTALGTEFGLVSYAMLLLPALVLLDI